MSENLLPRVSISNWLLSATAQLKQHDIQTARLDALVLLADQLQQDKAWLLAHLEEPVTSIQLRRLDNQLQKRLRNLPLAYVRGKQEFFGRSFYVTRAVLIPRPETESLIEVLLRLKPCAGDSLIDVGTGSGAIAITAKLEQPQLQVLATDVSIAALRIAQRNAKNLLADITFLKQNLLDPPLQKTNRFLIANLPYMAAHWQRSPETEYEPPLALFANDKGLALIKKLIAQSQQCLQPNGYLLLEADPRQHQAIINFAKQYGYFLVMIQGFAIALQRH